MLWGKIPIFNDRVGIACWILLKKDRITWNKHSFDWQNYLKQALFCLTELLETSIVLIVSLLSAIWDLWQLRPCVFVNFFALWILSKICKLQTTKKLLMARYHALFSSHLNDGIAIGSLQGSSSEIGMKRIFTLQIEE